MSNIAAENICKKLSSLHLTAQSLILQDKPMIKYIKQFLKDDDPSDDMLDNINEIIVSAKTLYENPKYVEPYPDELYDKMLSKFKKYRKEPFGESGVGLANAEYKYNSLSGTLNKVHFIYENQRSKLETRESLESYINKIPSNHLKVLVNQKKDGTSVTIDYKLVDDYYIGVSAISRGRKDYGTGTDVSIIIPDKKYSSIYLKKVLGFAPKYIGIQYEFLVSIEQKAAFEKYANQKFANCRSAASGLLRRILFSNAEEASKLKRYFSLSPVGFDILDKYVEDKSYYNLDWDKIYDGALSTFVYGGIEMDFKVLEGDKREILDQFSDLSSQWLKSRNQLNHAIDGMVLTIVDRDLERKLGRKNNINQWQIAYKFPEENYKTHVCGIEITTGMFGYKEMLLLVEPVVLNGTTQYKAQVHSIDRFNSLNLRYGDEIILKLSNDVIPYGYKDDTCERGDGEFIKFPTTCECGTKLIVENNKYRCPNPKCPFRVIGRMTQFFTELNAKGIGYQTCEQIYNELGIRSIPEILKLKEKDFLKLKGFKELSAKASMNTIRDVLTNPRSLSNIISAMGIDTLRSSTAEKILNKYSWDELAPIMESKNIVKLSCMLKACDGIDSNSYKIAQGLIDNCDDLFELVSMIPIKNTKDEFDKTILISGLRNDPELFEIAHNAGFNVKDSGSKYDILVIKTSDTVTGKVKSAQSKGKPILTRDDFIRKYKYPNTQI